MNAQQTARKSVELAAAVKREWKIAMADNYRLCPCGSGKKVKYCCKDLASEIEKVVKLISGEQRAAAVQALDRLIGKRGNVPVLLDLKVITLLEMQRFQEVEEVILTLLQADPDSPRPYALAAIVDVLKGGLDDAVVQLQRSLERVTEDERSSGLLDALRMVSMRLCEAEQTYKARAHLAKWASLCEDDEAVRQPLQVLMELDQNSHPLLQTDIPPLEPSEDDPWRDEYAAALRLKDKGAWLAAARKLGELAKQYPDLPSFKQQQAYTLGWASPQSELVAALRDFSRLDNADFDDAVEAEAMAMLLEDDSTKFTDVVAIDMVLSDQDLAMESLISHDQCYSVDPTRVPPLEEGSPPPKGVFVLLSLPVSDDPPTLDNTPRILGQVLLFGRQTDREPHITLVCNDDEAKVQSLDVLRQALPEGLSDESSRKVVGSNHPLKDIISPPLFFTANVPAGRQYELRIEAASHSLNQVWPESPNPNLGGKSPLDVADNPDMRVRLAAALVLIEQTQLYGQQRIDTSDLRRRLNLPQIDDVGGFEDVHRTKYSYLNVSKLDETELKKVIRAGVFRSRRVLAVEAVDEVIKRNLHETDEDLSLDTLYDLQAHWIESPDRLWEVIAAAQEHAGDNHRQRGEWMLKELVLRMRTGDLEIAKRLGGQIYEQYSDDPQIMQGLQQVLGGPNLSGGGGPQSQAEEMPSATDVALSMAQKESSGNEEGRIWTPDDPAPEGGADKPSGLWLPD